MKPQPVLTGMPITYEQPLVQQSQTDMQKPKKEFKISKDKKKLIIIAGITVVAFAVIIGIIVLISKFIPNNKREMEAEYSVVGEWKSEDLIDLEDIFEEIMEESGVPSWATAKVVSMLGMDKIGEVTLTFTPNGSIYIGTGGVSITAAHFSYEDLGNSKMMLMVDASEISILGTSIPIGVSYTSEYSVSKDTMVLDFFGYEAKFIREE